MTNTIGGSDLRADRELGSADGERGRLGGATIAPRGSAQKDAKITKKWWSWRESKHLGKIEMGCQKWSLIPLHSNWTELLDGLLELGTLPERIDNPNSAVILIVVKILAVDFQAARGFRRLDN